MATWSLKTSATSGDRLLNVGQSCIQLSSGALVFLVDDPAASNPNRISLQLCADHVSTPTTIATLSTDNFNRSGYSLSLSLCRDAADNLYVVGRDASSSDHIGLQAFKKGSGNTWNQQSYDSDDANAFDGATLGGFVAVWCNTGGGTNGAGHIVVIFDSTGTANYVATLDAGKALSGDDIGISYAAKNPAFLGAGTASFTGANFDLARDGFGATSGLAIAPTDTTHVKVGAWGVTSTGSITAGGGLVDAETTGTLSATTKCRLVRYASGAWLAVYPSSGNAGQMTCRTYSASAMIAAVDTGTASNFPAPSATLSWDVTAGAATGNQPWVFAWSSQASHRDDLLRLPISLSDPTSPTVGAVVVEQTNVSGGGASADLSTLRLVKETVDALHTDWQAYKSTTTYGLYGYYAALPAAPNAPTLTSPTSGQVVALAGGLLTLSWLFSSGVSGDAQTAAYVRVQAAGGAYQWWNGTTLQGTETTVSGLTTAQSVSVSGLSTSTTYAYSVRTAGGTGLLSGYASAVSFLVAATPPATPSLTASYDAANNRAALTLSGTGTLTTLTQYSDDGGVTWSGVRNAGAVVLSGGAATVYDWEIPAGKTRSYRTQQFDPSQGVYGTTSAWSTTQTATSTLAQFCLRDPTLGAVGVFFSVRPGSLQTHFPESFTEHRPPGRPDPIILSSVIGLEDGVATVFTVSAAADAAFMALANLQKTLLLQTSDKRQWYVRITGARPTLTPADVGAQTLFEHALTWVGQNRP